MIDKGNIEDFNVSAHARAYFKFIQLSSKVEQNLKLSLKPLGLTHIQLNVLSVLDSSDRPLSLIELKELLSLQSTDLSRLIDRLVTKAFVKRKLCPQNRRKVDLLITPKGADLFQQGHALAISAVDHYFSSLNSKEAIELYRLLKKVKL